MAEKKQTGPKTGLSRRAALGSAASLVAVAGAASAGYAWGAHSEEGEQQNASDSYDFHGDHQTGIETPAQDRMHFASLNVKVKDRDELQELFEDWTTAARQLMAGQPVGREKPYQAPPDDTGEAMDLSAAHLTLTFGLGRSLFVDADGNDRLGLKDKMPPALIEIPKMSGDMLEENRSGGDLCIQACADDPQVAVHAVRNLVRIARGRAVIAWSQLGFGRTSSTSTSQVTPRNLFGFKDGTANLKTEDPELLDQHVWASSSNSEGSPDWMTGGSYCATRRIAMMIEPWDRAPLQEQEEIVGRTKKEGAPLSGGGEFDEPDFSMQGKTGPIIPADSHVRLMHPDQNKGVQMLRRGYNYTDGTDGLGHLDAGLFFIAYVCDPRTHFVPLLQTMMKSDAMSEYLRHTGSALFAVPPGVKDENDFLASGLFA
ncbi:iron uptake transporter deferrochelatase/peroxidase subunit [Rothia aerolata]|uniref:Deferrochelatase n=1 Tax=Rothia aerolata TaxID=1812262 RepID=A0A917IUY5_9MICC|nr:iron uptake transporter deferrochelatase/peroxidase subunit [Rothia aerolata]GGH63804.1 iron-dependent peroxidase [Rothia aerolata]